MSPSPTDDLLVRELHERVDRTLPPMSLDVAAVLTAGRRRRHRQAALRGAGTLAVAAVATVGVVLLGTGRTESPPATPTPVYQDGTIAIRIADEVDEVMSDIGVVVDLGLPAELTSADQDEPSRWVVGANAQGTTTYYEFRTMTADGTAISRHTWGSTPAGLQTAQDGAPCFYWNMQSQIIAAGLAPDGLNGGTVELVVHDAVGASVRLPAPTFRVPGSAADMVAFTVTDIGVDGSGLVASEIPVASFEFTWPGGAVSECPVLSGEMTPDDVSTPDVPIDGVPSVPAPEPALLAPGIEAATGLSSVAGHVTGPEDDDARGTYYLAGRLNDADVRLRIGVPGDPSFVAFAIRTEAISQPSAGTGDTDSGEATFGRVADTSTTAFGDVRTGLFQAGTTPPGASRAFLFSLAGFTRADGSSRHVLELPTFTAPEPAQQYLGADQRMYLVGFAAPATDVRLDARSGLAFGADDGGVIVPGCEDLTEAECELGAVPGLFVEIRDLLASPAP